MKCMQFIFISCLLLSTNSEYCLCKYLRKEFEGWRRVCNVTSPVYWNNLGQRVVPYLIHVLWNDEMS